MKKEYDPELVAMAVSFCLSIAAIVVLWKMT